MAALFLNILILHYLLYIQTVVHTSHKTIHIWLEESIEPNPTTIKNMAIFCRLKEYL